MNDQEFENLLKQVQQEQEELEKQMEERDKC